jgi:hypothetical protein
MADKITNIYACKKQTHASKKSNPIKNTTGSIMCSKEIKDTLTPENAVYKTLYT